MAKLLTNLLKKEWIMNKARLTGTVLAVAAAAAFSLMPIAASAGHHHHMVKCHGVNACKGHGSCKTAKNTCKGHNACKGQSFTKMSKKACKKAGGTVE